MTTNSSLNRSKLLTGIEEVMSTLQRTQSLLEWMPLQVELEKSAANGVKISQDGMTLARHACMDATALAIRGLEDFLFDSRSSNKVKPDDMLAEDYGFTLPLGTQRILDKAQRDAINKRMMHLSWHRTDGKTLKMAPLACLKVLPPMVLFLKYLEEKFLSQSDIILPRVRIVREMLENDVQIGVPYSVGI